MSEQTCGTRCRGHQGGLGQHTEKKSVEFTSRNIQLRKYPELKTVGSGGVDEGATFCLCLTGHPLSDVGHWTR